MARPTRPARPPRTPSSSPARATPPGPTGSPPADDTPLMALIRRLRGAIREGRLTLTEPLLGDFADGARLLGDLITPLIDIDNVEVNLIEAEPGIVGAPGANVIVDDRLVTPGRSRIQILGDAALLGLPPVHVLVELFVVRFQPRYAVVFAVDSLGLGGLFPGVPIVRELALTAPNVVYTNQAVLYDPNRDAGINPGLNFYTNFTLAPSDADIAHDVEDVRADASQIGRQPPRDLAAIGGLLGVNDLAIHLAIYRAAASTGQGSAGALADGEPQPGPDARGSIVFLLEAAVQRTLPALGDARIGFIMRYTRSDVAVEIKGVPPEPSITISHDIVVSLNEGRIWPAGQILAGTVADVVPITGAAAEQVARVIADTRPDDRWTHLVFTGSIRLEAESITGAFTLNGTGRSTQGALTGNSPNRSVWRNPFGIPGVEIRQLALQLGGSYAPPWLDSVGMHGNLRIGGLDGSISILVDSNDPDNYVLAGTVADISILEVMLACLGGAPPVPPGLALVAYQALPESLAAPLEAVIGVRLQNVELTLVPAPTNIGGILFREPGVSFAGTLLIHGWRASARLIVDYVDGVTASGDMEAYAIDGILALRGAGDDPAPRMRLRIGPTSDPNFEISGAATLLGASASLLCRIDRRGLVFMFQQRTVDNLELDLECVIDRSGFRALGSLRFDLDLTVPALAARGVTLLPEIDLRGVLLDAALDLRATPSPSFALTARGAVAYRGRRHAFPPLRVDVPPEDFAALRDLLRDHIQREAVRIFRDVVTLDASPHVDLTVPRVSQQFSQAAHADVPATPGAARRVNQSIHADVPHANVRAHADRRAHVDVGVVSRRIHADVRSPHGDVARRTVSRHADAHADVPATPAVSRQVHVDEHGDVAPPHLDQAPHVDLASLFDRLGVEFDVDGDGDVDAFDRAEPAGPPASSDEPAPPEAAPAAPDEPAPAAAVATSGEG